MTLQIVASLTIVIDDAKVRKLASSITFIVLASFTIVTYDRQNMFIIQATGAGNTDYSLDIYDQSRRLSSLDPAVIPVIGKSFLKNILRLAYPCL